MNKTLIHCLILFVFFSACKKTSNNDGGQNNSEQGIISGLIQLPSGSSVSPGSLQVQTPIENGTVSNNSYSVNAFLNRHTTEFVVNGNQDVVMMGYHYPGQKEPNISATSSALALVMNSQSILFLSEAGKKTMAEKVLSDSKFPALVTAVETSIKANKNLLDETNTDLLQKMSDVYTSVAQRVRETQGVEAITWNKVGNALYFQNNGRAHKSVIGIYKDGSRIKKLVVEGVQYVPTSVSEVFNGYGGTSADPVQYPFSFVGDGGYEIKIRTGKPGAGDGAAENNEAFYENLGHISFNVMSTFYPLLNGSGCNKATITTNLISFFMATPEILGSRTTYAAVHDGLSLVFQNLDFAIGDCIQKGNDSYFKSIAKAFNFIDKAFSVIGNTANITFFASHWANTEPIKDTCLNLTGNALSSCLPAITTSNLDSITSVSVYCGGVLTSEGGSPIIQKGVCFSKTANPTISNTVRLPDNPTGGGGFRLRIEGLSSATTYYIRAFAKNKYGVYYGNQKTFTTLP